MTQDNRSARKSKLVRWDADFYKSLSSDDCVVCLTEQQIYLVGQIIEPLQWYNTRWVGDKSLLDFSAIAGNLEKRLGDRMTCEQITTLVSQVEALSIAINQIQGNEQQFNPNETTVSDYYTTSELSGIGYVVQSGCNVSDKDALYGGISQLVRYMHQKNIDFFQYLTQTANVTEQLDRLKTSTGFLNLIPANNALDFATFYIEELLQEYEATVDESLLQTTICDLFCIAVNSGCNFNLYDVFDYFASKTGPNFSNVATTLSDLIVFAITGTFVSDEYYYFATYFQLALAGLKQRYLNITSIDEYAYQFAAGFNSPDNDWSIFCLNCPQQYRLYTWDFADGMGEFEFDDFFGAGSLGTYANGRVQGTGTDTSKTLSIAWNNFDTAHRVMAAKLFLERVNGNTGQGNNDSALQLRPTPDSQVGSTQLCGGQNEVDGTFQKCQQLINPVYDDGTNQLYIFSRITKTGANPPVQVYLHKIEILFDAAYAPPDTRITEDGTLCS